jgi:hypothetical protein
MRYQHITMSNSSAATNKTALIRAGNPTRARDRIEGNTKDTYLSEPDNSHTESSEIPEDSSYLQETVSKFSSDSEDSTSDDEEPVVTWKELRDPRVAKPSRQNLKPRSRASKRSFQATFNPIEELPDEDDHQDARQVSRMKRGGRTSSFVSNRASSSSDAGSLGSSLKGLTITKPSSSYRNERGSHHT